MCVMPLMRMAAQGDHDVLCEYWVCVLLVPEGYCRLGRGVVHQTCWWIGWKSGLDGGRGALAWAGLTGMGLN
jgi:hypothetical protein